VYVYIIYTLATLHNTVTALQKTNKLPKNSNMRLKTHHNEHFVASLFTLCHSHMLMQLRAESVTKSGVEEFSKQYCHVTNVPF